MEAEGLPLDVLEHAITQVGFDAIRELEPEVATNSDADSEQQSDPDND